MSQKSTCPFYKNAVGNSSIIGRKIVSVTSALVGVDILSCPLHNAAKALGDGDVFCDYRLKWNR